MKLESEYAGPFHYISFYLTRDALDSVADDAGSPRIGDLCHRPGVGFSDPVARHLLLSLRPALAAGPTETSDLYADHVARAFVSHMASGLDDGAHHAAIHPQRSARRPGGERTCQEGDERRHFLRRLEAAQQ
jgi:hypothetical protein